MIRTAGITGKLDLDPAFGWRGILSAVRSAVRATVHTTTRATPSQLVFSRDALLHVSYEAKWEFIKERKQKLIVQNNMRENKKRMPHVYRVDDQVMIKLDPDRKHGADKYTGPFRITTVYDNGTVKLSKETNNGGAVLETWNIRNIDPCTA